MSPVRGSLGALKYGTDKAPTPSPAPGSKVQIVMRTMLSDTSDPSPSSHCQAMEKPLPYGWEMAVAPNGKNYYIDHNTQTTTWTCPDPDIMPLERFLDEDLPAGWEVRFLPEHNRKYYVDHNTRTTSWTPPSKELKSPLQESQVKENSTLERGSKPLADDRKSEEDSRTVSVKEGNSGKLLSKL
ncbi:MAG: hypothetical protein Q9191_007011 [Dirinaria sp. TL-2023a]